MKINLNNHVFLINEAKFSNNKKVIDEILCSFICNDACMKCPDCKKIISRKYFDLVEISATAGSAKESIDDFKTKFTNEGVERSGFKFYIIKDIDQLNKQSINKILKFVEEPPKKTIGVFLTKNINNVIETIRSRCEEIRLTPQIDEARRYITSKYGDKYIDFYLQSFNNIEEIDEFQESKNKEFIIELSTFLSTNFDYGNKLIDFSKKFKDLSYSEIAILIRSITDNYNINRYSKFLNLIKDLKINPNKILVFNQIIDIIKEEY